MKHLATALLIVPFLLVTSGAFAHPGHKHPQTDSSKSQKAVKGKTITMRLAGLHCEGCALSVADNLKRVPGVLKADVSQPKQMAILTIGKTVPSTKALKDAVLKAGYKVVKVELPK